MAIKAANPVDFKEAVSHFMLKSKLQNFSLNPIKVVNQTVNKVP